MTHTPRSIDCDVRRLLGTYAAEERDVAASARAERVCRRLEPMMNDADIAKRTKALRLVAEGPLVKRLDFQSFSRIMPKLSFGWALLKPEVRRFL